MYQISQRIILLAVLALLFPGCATLENMGIEDILSDQTDGPLDEATVIAGLKEALKVGSANASGQTSAVDGFLGNELIRIGMPDQLDTAALTLQTLGLGFYVEELETAMNRAAEEASAEAKDVFWGAITSMTIADAFAILNGHETAATEYFHDRTQVQLRQRFQPIVERTTESVGLGRIYGQLTDRYDQIPLVSKPELVDLDVYVTEKALDGLFVVLAQEEQAIRQDPAARTTELLRRVFGNR